VDTLSRATATAESRIIKFVEKQPAMASNIAIPPY
jgi:hypothetical protein